MKILLLLLLVITMMEDIIWEEFALKDFRNVFKYEDESWKECYERNVDIAKRTVLKLISEMKNRKVSVIFYRDGKDGGISIGGEIIEDYYSIEVDCDGYFIRYGFVMGERDGRCSEEYFKIDGDLYFLLFMLVRKLRYEVLWNL